MQVDEGFLEDVEAVVLRYRDSGQCVLYATCDSIMDTIKELREGAKNTEQANQPDSGE